MAIDRGAGHSHDQAEIRAQPIVGAEHRRPQSIPANRSMPAFQSTQETALEAAPLGRHELFEHPRVPSLLG